MKKDIHPKYNEYDVILTTGEVVKMRSTPLLWQFLQRNG